MLPGGLSSLATTLGFGKISNSVSAVTEKTRRTLSATDEYAKETVRKGGGFTDANTKISQQKADKVKTDLIKWE